jgi:hypothetical protein
MSDRRRRMGSRRTSAEDGHDVPVVAGGAGGEPPVTRDDHDQLGVGTGEAADPDAEVDEPPSEADESPLGTDSADPTGTGRPMLDDDHVGGDRGEDEFAGEETSDGR